MSSYSAEYEGTEEAAQRDMKRPKMRLKTKAAISPPQERQHSKRRIQVSVRLRDRELAGGTAGIQTEQTETKMSLASVDDSKADLAPKEPHPNPKSDKSGKAVSGRQIQRQTRSRKKRQT